MESAGSSLPAEGTCHGVCAPDRHSDTYEGHPTNGSLYNVEYTVKEKPIVRLEAASIRHSDSQSAASHTTAPMPSYSLRSLSFCVAILAIFAAHLQLASLSLLISRGTSQFALPDHAVDASPADPSVSSTKPESPPAVSRPLGEDSSTHVGTGAPQSNSDVAPALPSASAFSATGVQWAFQQQGTDTPQNLHTFSSRSLPELSQFRVAEQSTHSLGSFANMMLRVSRAAKAYVLWTFMEVLKAPSPLPRDVHFMEDLLIAWHLLLQAIGCLVCGALADVKGRRWVLSHSVRVLGASSFAFTLVALSTAHLSRPSTGTLNGDLSQSSTNARQSGADVLRSSNRPQVFAELSKSHFTDSNSSEGGTTSRPLWAYPSAAVPSLTKLTNFLPSVSSPLLWATLFHVLMFSSVACYSVAGLACGGVIVVAYCLCLEAAAPFPLKSTKDADSGHCLSTGAQLDENDDRSPAIRGRVARGRSPIANDAIREDAAACPDDDFSDGSRRENATVSLVLLNTPASSSASSTRASELRSPLLAERQRSITPLRTARIAFAQLCVRIRSLFTEFWRRCNGTPSCTIVQRTVSSTRTLLASVYRAFAPLCFVSSPYIPVAYLVGTQSAAYLFLPVAVSTVMEKLSNSTHFVPDGVASQFNADTLSPFALFCIAFSIPVLPICILLYVLTSCFLYENPYFIFQRRVLLKHLRVDGFTYDAAVRSPGRHLTIDVSQNSVPTALSRRYASHVLARAAGTATNAVRRSSLMPSRVSQRRSLAHMEKPHKGLPSLYPSLSLPIIPLFPSDLQHRYSEHRANAGHLLSTCHERVAQRRRTFSCSDGDNSASLRQPATSRRLASLYHNNAGLSEVLERCMKTTRCNAYDDMYLSGTEAVRGSERDEVHSLTTRRSISQRGHRRLLNVQLARSAVGAASQDVTDDEIHALQQKDMASEAETNRTQQQYDAADHSASASCSSIVDGLRKSLCVYRSYLSSSYSTSLRGVMLPAALIGAAFYLRGIFRFLLLDCVLIEDEVGGGTQTATVTARYTRFYLGANSKSNFTGMKTPPYPQIVSSTAYSTTSSPCSSPPCLTSFPVLSKAEPSSENVSAELLLFRLSTPVLLARLCTCVAPMLFLSMLPPKPMQILGCIFCAFMSFGIAVTLEALSQNFPDIPPISSARTASLLYEVVFCCCCCIPAFTSILLPMQGFHTGVRCALVATALACIRSAAAVSLVGVSVFLSYLPSLLYGEGPGGTSTSLLEGVVSVSDVNSFADPGTSPNTTAGIPTSSNDACSADAAVTAVVTCVYYVLAAAFTLLYTTHIRLPQIQISPQVMKSSGGTKPQDTKPKICIRRPSFHSKHGAALQERHQSQRWTMQWTENAQESTLLAVDNLLLHKLRPPLAVVCDRKHEAEDEAEDDNVESEAVPKY